MKAEPRTWTMAVDQSNTIPLTNNFVLGGSPISLDSFARISNSQLKASIAIDDELKLRMASSTEVVANAVDQGEIVYGVTTGFGGMADQAVPCELAAGLQKNLLSFLATGAGSPLNRRHVRGAMLLRANVLLQGYSGIRLEVVERLIEFLQADATPVVRCLGSIGASGDLVPLATIARAITGQSEFVKVEIEGQTLDGSVALRRLKMQPVELLPKEGLALVNGTSFSAAIAANATYEAKKLLTASIGVQAMMLRALLAQSEPFEAFVHNRKPHPGQIWSARTMKRLLEHDLNGKAANKRTAPVQDRYSVRCLPQYLGPIVEGFARIQQTVETEMNAVSDNPLVDPDEERFYQSGNFLGQHLAMAMDDLRRYIGLTAKHLDVQIASLVTAEFSGLPPSLRGNEQLPYNMGLKGLQISGNSIMPLLVHQGNSLVDHFPTHAEQYNQNINGLSFGAANLAWSSVEMFQQYVAISMQFAIQALDLRAKQLLDHYDGRAMLGANSRPIYEAICHALEIEPTRDQPYLFDDADRWLEQDIERLAASLADDGGLIDSLQPMLDSFNQEFGLSQ